MPRIAYKILRKAKERKLPFSRSVSMLYPAGWCTSSVDVASSQCPYWHHLRDPSAAGGMLDWEHGREDLMFQQRRNSLILNVPFHPFIFPNYPPISKIWELSVRELQVLLSSFVHHVYQLHLWNNTNAEIPNLGFRVQCFPVSTPPVSVWAFFHVSISHSAIYFSMESKCLWVLPSLSWTYLNSLPLVTLTGAVNTHNLWKSMPGSLNDKSKLESDIFFFNFILFIYLFWQWGAYLLAREPGA